MGISVWQLVIVLVIVLLLFGTKKLRSIGGDLGGAVKGFRGAMDKKDADETAAEAEKLENSDDSRIIEGEVTSQEKEKEKEKDKV